MNRMRAVFATLGQIYPWLHENRLLWMMPLVVFLLVLGVVLAIAAAHPAASPFVYLLF